MDTQRPPRDDLVRAMRPGMLFREADAGDAPVDGSLGTLTGHFSVWDTFYEVNSEWEGRFMERISPGAFLDTITNDRGEMRVLFQHGRDPNIGDKPLGPITELGEDKVGAFYSAALLDTAYNRELLPGLKADLYGASMRFTVQEEAWDDEPTKSKTNPDALPERTITRGRVYEFGPVTFPASPSATAGVRSLTDRFRGQPVERTTEPDPAPIAVAAPPIPKETSVPAIEEKKPPTTADPLDAYRDPVEMDEGIKSRLERMAEIDADTGTHVMTPEAKAEFEQADKEIVRLKSRIKDAEDRAKRIEEAKKLAARPASETDSRKQVNIVHQYTDSEIHDPVLARAWCRSDTEYRGLLRDHAMRVVERAEFPHPAVPQATAAGHVAKMLDTIDTPDKILARRIMTTDSEAYRRAFAKSIMYQSLTNEEQRAVMGVQTDTAGGFAIPFALDPTIVPIGAHTMTNPFRAACRTEQIVGTDTWRGVSATAVTATYATEGLAVADSSPTFAQPEVVANRAHSSVVYSIELGQDLPSIGAQMATLISEAKDNLEEAQFSNGTGATVFPMGMIALDATASFTEVTSTNAGSIVIGDLYRVEDAVPIRYRPKGAWFMSRFNIRAMQALEISSGQLFGGKNYASVGYPDVPNPTGNTGLTLLQYPVWEVPSAPADVTTNNVEAGAFGDPSQYIIVDRVGMNIELIPHFLDAVTGFPTGERVLYALWRNKAMPLNVDGMRRLKVQ